jgi:putative aldouronate transport system permease protein
MRGIKRTRHLTIGGQVEEVLFGAFKLVILGALVVATLYPFWNTVVVSFNQASDTIRGGLYLWPRQWSLNNYRVVWVTSRIPYALFISTSRAVIATVLNLFLTTMLAYALGRREFVLRRPLTLIVVLSLYITSACS